MLFFPKSNIFKYVYYDEVSSILFIEYCTKFDRMYYRLDRNFFQQVILPELRKDKDFRQLLFWGIKNKVAAQLDKNNPDVKLIDLNPYRGLF